MKINIKRIVSVLVICILCLNLVACGETSKKKAQGNKKQNNEVLDKNDDGTVELEEFNADNATAKCAGCEQALWYYYDLISAACEYSMEGHTATYAEDKECDDLNYNLHVALDHECVSPVIYVENIPYAYYGSLGNYTGYWKGCGPSGRGTYCGTNYFTNGTVSYTGDWVWGLPEGQGQLYAENFHNCGWDMTYTGDMQCGMRHGRGSMYEYHPAYNNRGGFYHRYRFQDESDWSLDVLASETQYEEYNADTDELLESGTMIGEAETCWVEITDVRKPSSGLLYGIGATAVTIGTFAVICAFAESMVESAEELAEAAHQMNSPEELNRYQEEKQEEARRDAEYAREKTADWAQRQYDYAKKYDPDNKNIDYWDSLRFQR